MDVPIRIEETRRETGIDGIGFFFWTHQGDKSCNFWVSLNVDFTIDFSLFWEGSEMPLISWENRKTRCLLSVAQNELNNFWGTFAQHHLRTNNQHCVWRNIERYTWSKQRITRWTTIPKSHNISLSKRPMCRGWDLQANYQSPSFILDESDPPLDQAMKCSTERQRAQSITTTRGNRSSIGF